MANLTLVNHCHKLPYALAFLSNQLGILFVILRRYMTWQVATTTALVLGFLVVMLLGGRLIRYFGIAVEGGLDVGVLFTLIGYNLPYFLELIFPLAFFIALMLVLGRMYADHEMAIVVGSGISRGRLSRLLVPLVLLAFVLQTWIALIGKPWGVERAANLWQEQSLVEVFDLIKPKSFISSGDYHLYVGEIGENREYLQDVLVIQMASDTPKQAATPLTDEQQQALSEFSEHKIPSELISEKDTLIYAKSATQVSGDGGVLQLDLHQGRRYEVDATSRKYSQVGFERYRISLDVAQPNEAKPVKIEGWRTADLWAVVQGKLPYDNVPEAKAELGYRVSLPWLIILALMLATPLAQVRPRQGRWFKLIPSVFIFVASALIVISLKESISKGKLGVWAYPVVIALFFAFALYLNYHERIMARFRLAKHQNAHNLNTQNPSVQTPQTKRSKL
ncbi:LPS export ABC transporter permease LptF [Moraxella caviae]|nr:LPS export ABC transporter permease LptF [Moraxella caviae]